MPNDIEFTLKTHKNRKVIFMRFDYEKERIARLKEKFPQAKWSSTQKAWYLPDTDANRQRLGLLPKPCSEKNSLKINEHNQAELKRIEEFLILKAYSPSTIKSYVNELYAYMQLLGTHKACQISADKIRAYILYCHKELKLSENTIHSRLNALKFYYEQVLGREQFFIEIPRPKRKCLLPKVISQKDIAAIFEVTTNLKHRVILQLAYGLGLRLSEIAKLELCDIDSGRMMVHIRNAKGKKDRLVRLPETILEPLRQYYKAYRPKNFLFEGENGNQYSLRSIQAVFSNACAKAKINKKTGIHGLRHSYATHLLEYGTDISFIQQLLGHNDIKTTLIYAQVSQINTLQILSPLDRLQNQSKGPIAQ